MAEPSPEKDSEIQAILSDLDNILGDLAGGNPAEAEKIAKAASALPPRPAPAPTPAPVAPPPTPAAAAPLSLNLPSSAAAPAPTPAPTPKPAVESAPPAGPPAAAPDLKIELAPREGTLPGKKKAPEPAATPKPKPALTTHPPLELPAAQPPASTPAAAPAPAAAAKPAAAPGATRFGDSVPPNTPKDQIRRVSLVHTQAEAEHCDMFVAFVDQSALTISKKPLYLRKVHSEVVDPKLDAPALVKRAVAAKAVAVLALVQDLPQDKARELADECQAAGLSFRAVEPSEVQKRSVAVDIMVDLMLLPGEE